MTVYRTIAKYSIAYDLDDINNVDLKNWIRTDLAKGNHVIEEITMKERKPIIIRILGSFPIMLKDIK